VGAGYGRRIKNLVLNLAVVITYSTGLGALVMCATTMRRMPGG